MKTLKTINQTVPANGEVSFNASGNNYYIYSATGSFTVTIGDGGTAVPHVAQTGIADGDNFERLTINDTSGATNTIVLLFGSGAPIYVDRR